MALPIEGPRLTTANSLAARETNQPLRRAFRRRAVSGVRQREASNSGYETVSHQKQVTRYDTIVTDRVPAGGDLPQSIENGSDIASYFRVTFVA